VRSLSQNTRPSFLLQSELVVVVVREAVPGDD